MAKKCINHRTHCYQRKIRTDWNKPVEVLQCTNCTSYISMSIGVGKINRCPDCSAEFQITERDIRKRIMRCPECVSQRIARKKALQAGGYSPNFGVLDLDDE